MIFFFLTKIKIVLLQPIIDASGYVMKNIRLKIDENLCQIYESSTTVEHILKQRILSFRDL